MTEALQMSMHLRSLEAKLNHTTLLLLTDYKQGSRCFLWLLKLGRTPTIKSMSFDFFPKLELLNRKHRIPQRPK